MNTTKLTLNLSFLFFSIIAFAQDTIYFENGETLECEVKSISEQDVTYIKLAEEGEEVIEKDLKPVKIKLKKTPVDYIKLNKPDKFYITSDMLTYVDSIYKIRPEYPEAFTTLVSEGKANLYLYHYGKVLGNKPKKQSKTSTATDTIKKLFTKGEYYTPTAWAVKKEGDFKAVSTLDNVSNKKTFKAFMSNFLSDCSKAIDKLNSKEFNKIMLMIIKAKTLVDYYNSDCN